MNTNDTIGMPCDDMSREELIAVVQSLLRSNTRLRDERMSLIVSKCGFKACYDNLSEQYKELEEENVKLRMSVHELLAMVDNGNNVLCTLCPFEDVCDEFNGTKVIGRKSIGCMIVENVKERKINGINV